MRIAALFSGAGGLDLGFQKAGFDVVWANEYDKTIWSTYQYNHPHTKLDTRSIKDIPNSDLPKNIDGLIGGPPCQSWSLAGSMKGIEDERGKLFFEYIRVLNHLKPKFFLIENVKGIVSKAHFNSFKHIVDLFEASGYSCYYDVLNAVDYEVPQTRERVFIIGIRKDININFTFPKKKDNKIVLKDILLDLEKDAKPFSKNNPNKTNFPNNEYLTGSFSSIFMSRNRIRDYHKASFTIQASGRHAPIHPSSPKMVKIDKDKFIFDGNIENVRRLSVRECARIQTFPDSFIFKYSHVNDGYKMIGNAVPVQLAFHIANAIASCFDTQKTAIKQNYQPINVANTIDDTCEIYTF